jgi:hypothetical protein
VHAGSSSSRLTHPSIFFLLHVASFLAGSWLLIFLSAWGAWPSLTPFPWADSISLRYQATPHSYVGHTNIPYLWSSYILTPLHSFTGPVGQPFASRLGGGAVHTRRVHPHFWNWDLLLAISRYRQAVYYPIVSVHNPHTVLVPYVTVEAALRR